MKIEFTKMQGAGNDYIYVNTLIYPLPNPEELAVAWSRPHTGIGSDGLVLIGSSGKADFSMRIFNADGSEAKMCGNASRCIGKYVYEYGLTRKTEVTLDTLSGIKTLRLHVEDGKVDAVTVDMGIPADIHPVDLGADMPYREGIAVSMGNPHLVIFVDDMEQVDLPRVGPVLEHHPLFPRPCERGVRTGIGSLPCPHACMGTRFGHHDGMRHRSVRHRRGIGIHPPLPRRIGHHHGRGHAPHPLGRRRHPPLHDRSRRESIRRCDNRVIDYLKRRLTRIILIYDLTIYYLLLGIKSYFVNRKIVNQNNLC